MKFLLGQTFLSTICVIILYYFFNTETFVPYLDENMINWENVLVLTFFVSVFLTNTISLVYMLINKLILKKEITKELLSRSLKIAGIFTLGIISVFALNFLHILNIYFGLGVLAIVILILLII